MKKEPSIKSGPGLAMRIAGVNWRTEGGVAPWTGTPRAGLVAWPASQRTEWTVPPLRRVPVARLFLVPSGGATLCAGAPRPPVGSRGARRVSFEDFFRAARVARQFREVANAPVAELSPTQRVHPVFDRQNHVHSNTSGFHPSVFCPARGGPRNPSHPQPLMF